MMTRRDFLAVGAGAAGLAATGAAFGAEPALRTPRVRRPGDPYRGFKVGVASYSLRKLSLDQTIEAMKAFRVPYITLKSMHLEYDTSPEERRAVAAKLKAEKLVLMGGGVIYMKNDEAEIRRYFQYAKDAGMPLIVGAPDPAGLDIVERMVKEFGIALAIHNHGPGDKQYPTPLDALKLVEGRDPRLGVCNDVGHTIRSGVDPAEAIRICGARTLDLHIKDLDRPEPKAQSTILGDGCIDLLSIFRALREIDFQGHVALEYERNDADPVPAMRECFAYVRGLLSTL
ncbi:MAG: sugar phosphate isomerase/epimerase [Planctomycetes bacterium]|nr:sugar phosphate isomerase/epimerase [Planctomycetota bacterium]